MVLSISLGALTGVVLAILLRNNYLRLGSALTAALFGWSLASTGLSPFIQNLVSDIAGWISALN